MSKPRSEATRFSGPAGAASSGARTGLAAVLVLLGIGYVAYYQLAVHDDGTPAAIGNLGLWNFAIGFGLLFLGLIVAAHPATPLGRGRGVVVGMLGCFLIGLAWIVVYYVTSQNAQIPLFAELSNYNLLVGIGFMATGFVYATRWE